MRAAAVDQRDYTTREIFDWADRRFRESGALGQPDQPNDHGGWLAWSQAFVLHSYLLMYETTHDTCYLDRLIENTDQVLASRDSERAVPDYLGRSLPAWRAGAPFTLGAATLRDAHGTPVLQVRSAVGYADAAQVRVLAGRTPDAFTLEVANASLGRTDTFADLTMARDSPDYVLRRLGEEFPTPLAVTAEELRNDGRPASRPADGCVELSSQFLVFALHTGLITYPVAGFVRLVREQPQLAADSRYARKATEYLAAVEAALAVHDAQWSENERGEGCYVWERGAPNRYDGVEMPLNQFLAPGRTHLQLAAITGDRGHAERATKLARSFVNQLRTRDDGPYVWSYWPTWARIYQGWDKGAGTSDYWPCFTGSRQPEDVSHGHIDIDFACLAYRDGIVFDDRDMTRLAQTYRSNIRARCADGTPTVRATVDGTGEIANLGMELIAPAWTPLAAWDETVFTHARDIYTHLQPDPAAISAPGYLLLATANLNRFAAQSGRTGENGSTT